MPVAADLRGVNSQKQEGFQDGSGVRQGDSEVTNLMRLA
jgi:hypothetical protein